MKLLHTAFLALIFTLTATLTSAQTQLGVRTGVNLSKFYGSMSDVTIDSESLTSFYLTGYLNTAIHKNFSVQPGLSLQGKGGMNSFMEDNIRKEEATNLLYVELPINVLYHISLVGGDFSAGLGPYVATGISGKTKIDDHKEDIEWGNDADFARWDTGLNFIIGYRFFEGLSIDAGYALGLKNMAPENELSIQQYNRAFSVGLGYLF